MNTELQHIIFEIGLYIGLICMSPMIFQFFRLLSRFATLWFCHPEAEITVIQNGQSRTIKFKGKKDSEIVDVLVKLKKDCHERK